MKQFVKVKPNFVKICHKILSPFYPCCCLHGDQPDPPLLKVSLWGFWWMMLSIWLLLPVLMTQFSQAVAPHKSLLSPTFLVLYLLLLLLSHVRCFPRFPPYMPAINNWTFHFVSYPNVKKNHIKDWTSLQGTRWRSVEKRGKKRRDDCGGRICCVSVGCAVCSLISCARKMWRGGRRGKTLFPLIKRGKNSVSTVMVGVDIHFCEEQDV